MARKIWKIMCDGKTITNDNIRDSGVSIKESLFSGDTLKFGECESTEFSVTITNTGDSFIGKQVTVTCEEEGKPTRTYPEFTIYTDKLNADRTSRSITGYDKLYDVSNADFTEWYDNLELPKTLGEIRNLFFSECGIEQEEVELINDDFIVYKREYERVTGKDIINAICEINACFPQMLFGLIIKFVELNAKLVPSKTLYPYPSLYPSAGMSKKNYGRVYRSFSYEDFTTQEISGVKVSTPEGAEYEFGEQKNAYKMSNIFCADNMTMLRAADTNMEEMMSRFIDVASNVTYTPCSLDVMSDADVNVGDLIEVVHRNGTTVKTFALNKTTSGGQALVDKITANGSEYQSDNVNSVYKKIKDISTTIEKQKLVVQELYAELIQADTILAESIRTTNLRVDGKLTTTDLEAEAAKVGILKADTIMADVASLGYATIGYVNAHEISADKITSGIIDSARISADTFSGRVIACGGINPGSVSCSTYNTSQGTLTPVEVRTGDGKSFWVLGKQITG